MRKRGTSNPNAKPAPNRSSFFLREEMCCFYRQKPASPRGEPRVTAMIATRQLTNLVATVRIRRADTWFPFSTYDGLPVRRPIASTETNSTACVAGEGWNGRSMIRTDGLEVRRTLQPTMRANCAMTLLSFQRQLVGFVVNRKRRLNCDGANNRRAAFDRLFVGSARCMPKCVTETSMGSNPVLPIRSLCFVRSTHEKSKCQRPQIIQHRRLSPRTQCIVQRRCRSRLWWLAMVRSAFGLCSRWSNVNSITRVEFRSSVKNLSPLTIG